MNGLVIAWEDWRSVSHAEYRSHVAAALLSTQQECSKSLLVFDEHRYVFCQTKKKKKKSRTFLWNQSNSFPLQPRSPSEQLVSRTFGGSSRSFHGQHRHKAASCTSVMPSLWLSLTCEAAYSWMTFLWGFFCRRQLWSCTYLESEPPGRHRKQWKKWNKVWICSHETLLLLQVHSLCFWPGKRAVVDEGELRSASERQPLAQRGDFPRQQQRSHPQDRFPHCHAARQRSPQPGPKGFVCFI